MRNGFSLVELSIVLVILGLLTGGILAGQSLIKAAELRAVSTEFSRYTTALYSFRDKYFSLPGDFAKAYDFWGVAAGCTNVDVSTNTAGCNGNGNGAITSLNDGESARAWQHMALAGLIEGNYTGIWGTAPYQPKSKRSKGEWMIKYWDNGAHGWTANVPPFGANQFAYDGYAINPEEAWNIDTKLDDGNAAGGKIYAHVSNGCTTTSDWLTAQYNLTSLSSSCILLIKLQ